MQYIKGWRLQRLEVWQVGNQPDFVNTIWQPCLDVSKMTTLSDRALGLDILFLLGQQKMLDVELQAKLGAISFTNNSVWSPRRYGWPNGRRKECCGPSYGASRNATDLRELLNQWALQKCWLVQLYSVFDSSLGTQMITMGEEDIN